MFINIIYFFLVAQAIIGFFAIEWAFSRNTRFMTLDEERDKNYPAFRRYDSKNWKRWKFYLGAMLWMPTRFFIMFLCGSSIVLFSYPFTCGHDFRRTRQFFGRTCTPSASGQGHSDCARDMIRTSPFEKKHERARTLRLSRRERHHHHCAPHRATRERAWQR